ncbi:MAG: hypothetical protein ABI315_15060 [Bacteroidia bacterium]
MRKVLKLTFILTTFALYGFVISLCSSNALMGSASLSESNSQTEYYNSLISSNLLYHISQTENSISVFRHSPPHSLKKPFNDFSSNLKTAERLYVHTFLQYQFYSKNVLVRLQSTDIIYPFHSFW